jgi:hypothetical protein
MHLDLIDTISMRRSSLEDTNIGMRSGWDSREGYSRLVKDVILGAERRERVIEAIVRFVLL